MFLKEYFNFSKFKVMNSNTTVFWVKTEVKLRVLIFISTKNSNWYLIEATFKFFLLNLLGLYSVWPILRLEDLSQGGAVVLNSTTRWNKASFNLTNFYFAYTFMWTPRMTKPGQLRLPWLILILHSSTLFYLMLHL